VKLGRIPSLLIRNTLVPAALLMDDAANVRLSKVHRLPKNDFQLTLSLRSGFEWWQLDKAPHAD
jgi:hypothetical protein